MIEQYLQNIDTFSMLLITLLLLLTVIAPFFSPFFRFRCILHKFNLTDTMVDKVSKTNAASANTELAMTNTLPSISVLITPQDQAIELKKHLHSLLSQTYKGNFQVIVVCDQGDLETENVLKLHANNPKLYYTFVPSSSRYMSRKKLATTIGVKAASYDWIIMVDANSEPSSNNWLSNMTQHCSTTGSLVLGYSNYGEDTLSIYRLEHLYNELYQLWKAQKGTPCTTLSRNLVFKKEAFIKEDGYRGNLHLVRGEYDFIVNKLATEDNTALQLAKEAWITVDKPSLKEIINKQLYAKSISNHLNRKFKINVISFIDSFVLNTTYITFIINITYFALQKQWLFETICMVLLFSFFSLRILLSKKTLKYFLPEISIFNIIPFEIVMIWRKLYYTIKYISADKYNFTTHKV